MRKWRLYGSMAMIVVLIPWYFVTSQQETLSYYLHQAYDRVNRRLMFTTWSGPSAQDPVLTPQAVFADIFDPTCNCLRTSGAAGTVNTLLFEPLPDTCTLNERVMVLPEAIEYFCVQDAEGEPNPKCQPDGLPCYTRIDPPQTPALTTPGLSYSGTGVQGIRFTETVVASGDECLLGTHSLVNVTAGSTGKTCYLPNPALATALTMRVYVVDDNYLTLAPTEGVVLNGEASPLPPIRGPDAYYDVTYVNGEWKATATGTVVFGAPMALICNLRGGSTNDSSSGSGSFVDHTLPGACTIPANHLTTGSLLRVCPQFSWTVGSAPPTHRWRLRLNSTAVYEVPGSGLAPVPTADSRSGSPCVTVTALAAPSASSDTYTNVEMPGGGINIAAAQNWITQPVAFPTNADITLTIGTRWSAVGTGTTFIVLDGLLVYASGLKH